MSSPFACATADTTVESVHMFGNTIARLAEMSKMVRICQCLLDMNPTDVSAQVAEAMHYSLENMHRMDWRHPWLGAVGLRTRAEVTQVLANACTASGAVRQAAVWLRVSHGLRNEVRARENDCITDCPSKT